MDESCVVRTYSTMWGQGQEEGVRSATTTLRLEGQPAEEIGEVSRSVEGQAPLTRDTQAGRAARRRDRLKERGGGQLVGLQAGAEP